MGRIYDNEVEALAVAVTRLLDKPKKRVRVPTPAVVLPSTGGGIPDVVLAAADTKFTADADLLSGSFASDAAMVAAALQRMGSVGHAWIHFLEGNFTISDDTFFDQYGLVDVKITGAGMGLTTIKVADGASIIAPFWAGGSAESADTIQKLTFEDLTIDGNKAGLTTVSRGLISGSAGASDLVFLNRVELKNSPNVGLGGNDAPSRTLNHWFLTDCYIHDNTDKGLSLSDSSSTIKGCRIEGNGGDGLFALFAGTHKISSSVIANNTGDGIDGVNLNGLASFVVTGSLIDGNGGAGIAGGGLAPPSVIVGNIITNNVGQSINVMSDSVTGPNVFSGNGTDAPSPPQAVTDHGALTGLLDDDHTQYLLADGTRTAALLDVTAQVTAQYFDADGLTGAASASRYVGATASGAPVAGTFALGDFVITHDGEIYVCTTAGSPGTWTSVGAAAATDTDAIHDNVSGEIDAITQKATPVDADLLIIEDSAASFAKKKISIGSLPAGGGGGATPLDPDDIANLVCWVSADAIVGLADGDPVTTWADRTVNGNDFTQATAAAKPTYQTNEINGLAVVRFDGTDDGMEGGPSLSAPFSIFYVVRPVAGTGNRRAIQGNVANWLLGPYGGKWQWFSGAFATDLGDITAARTVVHGVVQTASMGWHFLYDGQATSVFPVGVENLTSASRGSPGDIGQMALGASGAFAEALDADIAEIAVYTRALDQDEGDGLIAGWVTKYAL